MMPNLSTHRTLHDKSAQRQWFQTLGAKMIVHSVQQYLATRAVAVGEIVHAAWLVFRVAELGPPVELESLDFKNIASFTRDLNEAPRTPDISHSPAELTPAARFRLTAVVGWLPRSGDPPHQSE
ncbi:hypothetical protein HA051_14720 [Chromobacterium vaccinii]|nr:hypothetical protein [Chromobacterium vaccinii]